MELLSPQGQPWVLGHSWSRHLRMHFTPQSFRQHIASTVTQSLYSVSPTPVALFTHRWTNHSSRQTMNSWTKQSQGLQISGQVSPLGTVPHGPRPPEQLSTEDGDHRVTQRSMTSRFPYLPRACRWVHTISTTSTSALILRW